jgi:membrane protein implicated in regulation of membrane protease activity
MNASFIHITPDRWIIVSAIFLAFSLFVPKRIPWIISGTAFATGVISFVYPFLGGCPLSTAIQLAIFSVLLILGLLFIQTAVPSLDPTLNKKDIFVLTSPIKNGKGTLKKGGISYTLIGPDCPGQTPVVVVSIQGNTIYVSPVKQDE